MVVDDSRAMRRILSGILGGLGFEVTEAGDGREALALLAGLPAVDLALVDWNMPEMDGLSFVRAVRERPEWSGLRLLMVTTETEMDRVAEALGAGADEYAMKPFTADVIHDKLVLLGLA